MIKSFDDFIFTRQNAMVIHKINLVAHATLYTASNVLVG